MKGSETFADLALKGNQLISKVRERGWSPSFEKNLRTFGASEAARMVGKNRETIRKHEVAESLPQPQKINGQKAISVKGL